VLTNGPPEAGRSSVVMGQRGSNSLRAVADCLFCGIVEGSIPSQMIDSDERTIAFMDIAPATPGHALVVPRVHSADLMEINPEDLSATVQAARRLARRMRNVLGADGINLINACGAAAWQTVFHFHIHVVPRYEDDPLKLPWIPREGDQEQIAEIADKLRGGDG
jgi:histidine triad (HIT) family protein